MDHAPRGDEKDIAVEVSKNLLTVSGFKREPTETLVEKAFFRERSFGRFERRILLPSEVDRNRVVVSLHRGVLAIGLLRRLEPRASRRAPTLPTSSVPSS